MNQEYRIRIANDTLNTLTSGSYCNPSGQTVPVQAHLDKAVATTQTYTQNALPSAALQRFPHAAPPRVTAETSLEVLRRLGQEARPRIGILNFASARNPGGSFLRGTQAQEEALARSSGLYSCLLTQMDSFYEPNRNIESLLYLDTAIGSPDVPFFKDDEGNYWPDVLTATVVTAAAPNAGAIAQNQPHNTGLIQQTLQQRGSMVLHIFAALEVETLVLGAWGCGVFRNDPNQVASIFAQLLLGDGKYRHAFDSVTFAIPGKEDDANRQAFLRIFSDEYH